MDAAKPKAVFFTGTNGSGKSTMRESMLKDGEFSQDFVHIDPDKIAREINPDDPRSVDMEAGRLAIGQFKQAIAEKHSFSMETTLTGSSVLGRMKKAKEAGYEIEVYHVGLAHPDINVARVQARVSLGGHHIDETVIRKRFHESQENLKAVIDQKLADNLCVIDNSGKSYSIGFVTKDQKLIYENKHNEVNWIKDVGQSLFEPHTPEASQQKGIEFSFEDAEPSQNNSLVSANGFVATLAMRRHLLDKAEKNVGDSVRNLWQQPAMAPVLGKIKHLSEKHQVSETEVLAQLKDGNQLDQTLDKEIHDVIDGSDDIQKAINKIGGALTQWQRSHGRLSETVDYMAENNHPLKQDTVNALIHSEATLAIYVENVPSNGQLETDISKTQDYIKQSQHNRNAQAEHMQTMRGIESPSNSFSP